MVKAEDKKRRLGSRKFMAATIATPVATVAALLWGTLDPSSLDFLAATFAIATVGASIGAILGEFRKSDAKRSSVEHEMTAAIGLPPEPKLPSEPAPEPWPEVPPGNPEAEGGPEHTTKQTSSPYYGQHVEINVAGERAATEIADLVRQQSDGHARLVIKYYAQGHTQASISFMLSMAFAVVGFALIAIALVQVLQQPDQPIAAGVTGLVGIVNQAVSVLFFRRADKGRDLMMQLIDKLRTDRETEMKFVAGLNTIEQVHAGGLKDALRAAAALAFMASPLNLEHLAGLVKSGALDAGATSQAPRINVFGPQGRNDDSNSQDSRTRMSNSASD